MTLIAHQPLNQVVYQRLRSLVLSGVAAPGEQLNELAIANQLGVSRTPLREAIGQLVAEGLVEDRPYRGKFVRTFTAREIHDIYEVRSVLEGHAARLATTRMTPLRLTELRQILDQVQQALDAGDFSGYGVADQQFHEAIARFSENQTLIDSLQRLSVQVQLIRTVANRNPEVVRQTALERPRIIAAIAAGDADQAARLLQEHILGVRRSLTENTG